MSITIEKEIEIEKELIYFYRRLVNVKVFYLLFKMDNLIKTRDEIDKDSIELMQKSRSLCDNSKIYLSPKFHWVTTF